MPSPRLSLEKASAWRFAARYENPATSGIEVNVVPGRNRFDFKLDAEEDH